MRFSDKILVSWPAGLSLPSLLYRCGAREAGVHDRGQAARVLFNNAFMAEDARRLMKLFGKGGT